MAMRAVLCVCIISLATTTIASGAEEWIIPIAAEASDFTVWGGTWYTGPAELSIDDNEITAWTLKDLGTITFDLGDDYAIQAIDIYRGGHTTNGNAGNVYVDNVKVISEKVFGGTMEIAVINGRYVTLEFLPIPHNVYLQIATWSEVGEFKVLVTTDPKPRCLNKPIMDGNGDCKVDIQDLAILVAEWLSCGLDIQEACWE